MVGSERSAEPDADNAELVNLGASTEKGDASVGRSSVLRRLAYEWIASWPYERGHYGKRIFLG